MNYPLVVYSLIPLWSAVWGWSIYIYTYLFIFLHIYTCIYIYTYIYIGMCIYINIYVNIYIGMYIYIYIHIYRYVYIYIHTYLHKQTGLFSPGPQAVLPLAFPPPQNRPSKRGVRPPPLPRTDPCPATHPHPPVRCRATLLRWRTLRGGRPI